MPESSELSAGERGALQVVGHLLGRTMGLRLATGPDRERTLRDFGLTPEQIAYLDHVLANARSGVVRAASAPGVGVDDLVAPDPPEVVVPVTCPIAWNPTILTPVFWGREHVVVGARETPVTIYYPSLDGAPDGAAMLRNCGPRALILFLHGHCQNEIDHLHRWERHLAQLARSGFVVAAPFQSEIGAGPLQDSLLDGALEVLGWMRNSWSGRAELHAQATGIAGHSYGAMLAGRVAVTSNASAYASLSANWHEWSTFGSGIPEPLPDVTMPSLHMWGTEGLFSDEVTGARWDGIPGSKHAVILHGGSHWQYLQGQTGGCAPQATECRHLGSVAGDLLACFLARYLPPAREHESGARIPISLLPPDVPLTFDQEFFAGGHLTGLKMIPFSEGCEITAQWETASGSTGSVTLASPG